MVTCKPTLEKREHRLISTHSSQSPRHNFTKARSTRPVQQGLRCAGRCAHGSLQAFRHRLLMRYSRFGMGSVMFRIGITSTLLLAALSGASAESPVEQGSYLVNTIMACGNCHTPRDADGRAITDKALSGGGLTLTTPAFTATAPNITQDAETGIGSWSDAEIKRALVAGMRPDHGHLAGVPLAAIMPANFYRGLLPDDLDAIIAYLRDVKPVRNEVQNPIYKVPVRRDPYPDADAGFDKTMFADPVRH